MSHALLSPSASHRWIECPPSARLTEFYADTTSAYAADGTIAHSIAEAKLNSKLGRTKESPKCEDNEMDEYTDDYVAFVAEQMTKLTNPTAYVEQQVDCSAYIPECFGTCDALLVSDGILHIIDLKSGRGIKIAAKENDQLRIYALGALNNEKAAADEALRRCICAERCGASARGYNHIRQSVSGHEHCRKT